MPYKTMWEPNTNAGESIAKMLDEQEAQGWTLVAVRPAYKDRVQIHGPVYIFHKAQT